MGHQPSLERYSKTCYFSRQVSFVSKNPLPLGMGSMSTTEAKAIIGNKIPVSAKPIIAQPTCSPDTKPIIGGKIKLPEPKKDGKHRKTHN